MRDMLDPAPPGAVTPPPALPAVPGPAPEGRRQAAGRPSGDRPGRPPMVERIACWSARHRVSVIIGWLVLAAVAMLAGQLLGTQNQQQYDPGQSGQAERVLHQLGVVSPPAETVLLQARGPGPGTTWAHDPALRGAVADVVSALRAHPGAARGIRSPLSPGGQAMVSANGRTVLVTFDVAGPHAQADTTVGTDLAAVARVAAAHRGLSISRGR